MTQKISKKNLKVTKKDFKAWLESKKPSSSVGKAMQYRSCPIARYLRDKNGLGVKQVHVSDDYISVRAIGGGYLNGAPTAKWVFNFVHKVDFSKVCKISAKKALDILSEC